MFGKAFNLCRLFGFQIRIDLSWFFIAAILTWSLAAGYFPYQYSDAGLTRGTFWLMGIAGAIGLFVCILLHELGHASVARRFGLEMRSITLFVFGGVAEMPDEPPSPKAEFWVAVGGPAVSFLLIGLFWALARLPWAVPVTAVFSYLAWINLLVVGFNLIPAFPLDGGRVLRSVIWKVKNDLNAATRITSRIGTGFAFVLMAFAVLSLFAGDLMGAIWIFLIAMFLRSAAIGSYRQLRAREMLKDRPISRFMNDHPTTVGPEMTIDRFVDEYVYKYSHKAFPVVNEEQDLVGFVGFEQLRHVPRDQWTECTVGQIVEPMNDQNTVEPRTDAMAALNKMSRGHRSRLLVADHNHLVGIVAIKDLMSFLRIRLELEDSHQSFA